MSLKIWLPLNGSTVNQGIADFQPAAASVIYSSGGKIGALACSGGTISMTASQTASIFNNNEITIAFWIKTVQSNNNTSIFGNSNMDANNNRKFNIWQWPTAQDLHWSWMNDAAGDAGVFASDTISNGLPANTWVHVCFAYKNSTLKVYLNGQLEKTQSGVVSNSASFSYDTILLHSSDLRYINDLRVYDHCLSPREVKLLAQGLITHYKLDNGNPNLLNTLSGTRESGYYNYKFDRNGFGRFLTNGETCTLTICFTPTSNFQKFRPHFDNGNIPCTADYPSDYDSSISNGQRQIITLACASNYSGSNTPTTTNTVADLRLYVRRNSDSAYDSSVVTIHWVKLQIGAHTNITTWSPSVSEQASYYNMEYDCSGYGNHGTKSAVLNGNENTPRYDNCANFNDNKYIAIPSRSYDGMKNSYTFSYWSKIDEIHGKMAFGFIDGNHLNMFPWNNESNANAAPAKSWFNWNTNDSAQNPFKKDGSNVLISPYNGAWHHYAITGNGSTNTLYIDGEYAGTALNYCTITGTQIILSGYDTSANYKWNNGQISDFRIYATALPAVAIKELYQSSISFLNNGTLQCSEIVENNTNLKYNQNGIVQANELNEIGYIDQMKTKTLSDGSAWARIHWLDVTSTQTYFTEAEVQECTTASNRFSLMKYVEYFKQNNNYYEFMLTHPKLSATAYNRWKQTSSPNSNTISGFSTVGTQAWGEANHGIRKHDGVHCVYNCDEGGTWYAPIGQFGVWNGGIPAANQSNTATTEIELWVRIDNLPKLTKLSMFNRALQAHQIYEL